MKRVLTLGVCSALLMLWVHSSIAEQNVRFTDSHENQYPILISDNLFLYSSSVLSFDIQAFLDTLPGPLKDYREEADDKSWSATEIIDHHAMRYGINPQLILVLLEAKNELLSNPDAEIPKLPYSNSTEQNKATFYSYVGRDAEILLRAFQEKQYYVGDELIISSDKESITIPTNINAGSYAVQTFLVANLARIKWEQWIMGEEPVFIQQYSQWFGNPNDVPHTVDTPSTFPDGYILPFTVGETWYYTSGPHNYLGGDVGCVSGSGCPRPWSSIDIAQYEVISCPGGNPPPNHWVVAAKGGTVEHAFNALVVIDHGDGWRTYYLHLDGIIVQQNTNVEQGERLGHPSCMGGHTFGVHLHFAIWQDGGNGFVDIDGSILSNWEIQESTHYNGELINNDVTKVAYTGRDFDTNGISNLPYDDNFNTDNLSSNWFWIREDPTHWYLLYPPGYLRMITQQKDIVRDSNSAPLLLQSLKPFSSDDFEIRTRVVITPVANFHQAGLVVYENDDDYVRFTYAYINGPTFEFAKEIGRNFQPIQVPAPPNINDFHLRISKLGRNYYSYYSRDGENWILIGIHKNVDISPSSVGVLAFNSRWNTSLKIPADFDYFQLRDHQRILLPMIVR